ncbi:MAG: LysM peptidoglycan-binding domain-containing protein [Clostridia bacterium]|nr:LysM peptidoglycan-binding domain-containing protein [Clostridia bacterium]
MELDKRWGKRKKLIIILGLILVGSIWSAIPAEQVQAKIYNKTYQVRPGDTLSAIALRYGVSVSTIQAANSLKDSKIIAGEKIIIPIGASEALDYQVQPGDNLYQVAKRYGLSIKFLKQVNNLNSTLIRTGQVLFIPMSANNTSDNPVIGTLAAGNKEVMGFSEEEVNLLARLIHAEARGETLEGKIAVGAVVLNRLAHPDYPKNLRDIIYQKNDWVYQFSPVQDGSINMEPDEESVEAAFEAIKGVDPTGGAIFFYNPKTATDQWIKTLPTIKPIGNHVFANE